MAASDESAAKKLDLSREVMHPDSHSTLRCSLFAIRLHVICKLQHVLLLDPCMWRSWPCFLRAHPRSLQAAEIQQPGRVTCWQWASLRTPCLINRVRSHVRCSHFPTCKIPLFPARKHKLDMRCRRWRGLPGCGTGSLGWKLGWHPHRAHRESRVQGKAGRWSSKSSHHTGHPMRDCLYIVFLCISTYSMF